MTNEQYQDKNALVLQQKSILTNVLLICWEPFFELISYIRVEIRFWQIHSNALINIITWVVASVHRERLCNCIRLPKQNGTRAARPRSNVPSFRAMPILRRTFPKLELIPGPACLTQYQPESRLGSQAWTLAHKPLPWAFQNHELMIISLKFQRKPGMEIKVTK